MSADNKDSSRTTIAHLVATNDIESYDLPEPVQSSPNSEDVSGKARIGPERILIQGRLRAANMLMPGSPLGPEFNDEYRRIKRPLLSNAFGKTASLVDRGNLMLVTSSVPGEGKTYTSINLALSFAQERDHTVLLVDCDVAKKGVSRMLGVAHMPGLMDLLENEYFSIGDALLRTDIEGLSVLSAGKHHEYATELLASQRMSHLVNEMASRYEDRIIIFDAPPLLPTPQTQVLAELVGQIIFVIEAGKTPQSVVEEALEMLPDDQAVGLIMNKSQGLSGRSGHYYGYYGLESDKKK